MNFWKRLGQWLDKDTNTKILIRIILVLLIILLVSATGSVWKWIWSRVWLVTEPFFYGFAIAYVLHPLIDWMEKEKHISRSLAITVIYALLLIFIFWLIFTLIPMLFDRMSGFLTSMINGVDSLSSSINRLLEEGTPNWLNELIGSVITALKDTRSYLPQVTSQIPTVFNQALHTVTLFVMTFIISIYMCSSWSSVRNAVAKFFHRISSYSDPYLHAVNTELGSYIRSLIVLMIIKFAEYSLLYFLVGHKDWLLIGILTSIGLIVPYLGATLANCIGILTALTLPLPRVIILIVCIIILSNIDAYVIGPLVHSHNVSITPLWALFSIFAGSAIAPGYGTMLAIPVYLSIRAVVRTHRSLGADSSASAVV